MTATQPKGSETLSRLRSRRGRVVAACLLSFGLSTVPAMAAAAPKALTVIGSGGTQATLVLKQPATITAMDWTNRKSTSPDAGIAISGGSLSTPLAAVWLPSLEHSDEVVRTASLPFKLPKGSYTVSLLGSDRLTLRLAWSGPNVHLSPRSHARLHLTTKTGFGTAPFNWRWQLDFPSNATVIEGYVVSGTSNATAVRHCFAPGTDSCLPPLGGYSGTSTSGRLMYYLIYTPGQAFGPYSLGELAVSDSPTMKAGAFVVSLAP